MKKYFKSIVAILVISVMSFSLVGCGNSSNSSGSTSKKVSPATSSTAPNTKSAIGDKVDTTAYKSKKSHYTIGFSNASVVNSWRVQMVYELQQEADKLGVTLDVTNAGGDAAKQVSDIQDLLAKGVDALIVAPASSSATNSVCKQALGQGIPVIVVNAEVTDKSSFVGFVGTDATAFGYTLGKWLVAKLNGKGNIIVLDGTAGNMINQQREDGLKKAIAELPDGGTNIKILATYHADWAYDKGKQSAEQALAAYPKIDGVWSQGGAMTQGAIEAFQAAGRPLVPMTGEDNNGFLKLWQKNSTKGFSSVAASEPTWQSAVALDEALDALAGKSILRMNYIAIPTITDAQLNNYVKPNYSDSYWCNSHLLKATADKYFKQ